LRQVPAITELAQIDAAGHEQLKVSRLTMDVVGSGIDESQKPKFTQAVAHKVIHDLVMEGIDTVLQVAAIRQSRD
jgi:hypothetical protein